MEALGGFSYAFNATMQIVTRKTSVKKSYKVKVLSDVLTKEFGKGFSERNLADFRKFYHFFPDEQILQTRLQNLTWSHFRNLLRVPDENARLWYMNVMRLKKCMLSHAIDRAHDDLCMTILYIKDDVAIPTNQITSISEL